MATFQTQATDKNGKVLLGKLRSVSTQDGFDTALCTSALGLACLGGGGCDVCCTAIFCPCFLFGSNVKILRSGSYQSPCVDVTGCKRSAPCVKFLVPYTCIAMAGYTFLPIGPLAFCPLAMYTASYRHLIRKEFGITSSGQCVPGFSNDICVHFFCFPFALCQEHAELRSHLPFTPLKTMYTNTGESLGVADRKKPEKFKWSFNLDDVSDDDNDAGEGTGSFPVTQIIDDLFPALYGVQGRTPFQSRIYTRSETLTRLVLPDASREEAGGEASGGFNERAAGARHVGRRREQRRRQKRNASSSRLRNRPEAHAQTGRQRVRGRSV
jgi:Cys-rich protein (TIGR01571 family)